jgi:hypothetical protein
MNELLRYLLLTLILAAAPTGTAAAACMNGDHSVAAEYTRSQYVVIVKVLGAKQIPETKDQFFYDGLMYRVKVEKTFKGSPVNSLNVFSENSSGGFAEEIGREYVLFLYLEDGRFQVDNCGNSDVLAKSSRTITRLKKIMTKEPRRQQSSN